MKKTVFGTCGIRKKFDEDFSGPKWLEIGMAIGTYLGKGSMVLIGRDTRQTAELVEYAIVSGLLSCGCQVYILQGSRESPYVTTSTIAYSTKHFQADAGIQVTASHNTPDYIGIKIWQKSGMGFSPAMEEEIDSIFAKKRFRLAKWNEIKKVKYILNANDTHLQAILEHIEVPLPFKKKVTIAVDPGNGAACEIGPRLLQKLGVNVVTINAQPDGLFPGRNSEPTEHNLRTLIKMVKNDDELFLGVAYDGDADRVRFVDGKGVLHDGDRVLLLFALNLIESGKGSPSVVTPINSSKVLEDQLEEKGISVSRTKIGDISVAIRMQETNARIGGEISGTYTWPEIHLGPDSLFSTAKLLELLANKCCLEEMMENIPQYHVFHDNIEFSEEIFREITRTKLEGLMVEFAREKHINIQEITKLDGIHVSLPGGFLLIRTSGTSPLIRITSEHEQEQRAKELIEKLKVAVTSSIG